MNNMELWRSVEKTDPSHTKKVNQRGGFTSISAHYQVMRATEAFGPVGTGWGYDCGAPIFHADFIIIPVTVWYRDRTNTFGPVYGCAEIIGKRPDSDAPKKAMTDALTKALSHLGFNADVFLGKFDDNKYVAEVAQEFRSVEVQSNAPTADAVKANLMACKTLADLQSQWASIYRNHRAIADDPEVVAAKEVRKEQLQPRENAA